MTESQNNNQDIIIGSHGSAVATIISYLDPTFSYLHFKAIQQKILFIVEFDFNYDSVDYRIMFP